MAFASFSRGIVAVLIFSVVAGFVSPSQAQVPPSTPVIEAGTIVGDFARDYDRAADKYSMEGVMLVGRVASVNVGRGADGHTYVSVHVVPRELGSGSMIPIYVDFSEQMASQVRKLKPGDLVRIDVTYSPVPAPVPIIHELRGFIGEKIEIDGADLQPTKLRADVVGWIRKNNALKPGPGGADNDLVKDMSQKIDVSVERGDDFWMTFGSGLMGSMRATVLCVQDGTMFAIELTPAHAAVMNIPAMSATYATIPSSDVRMPAEYEMKAPVMVGDGLWDLSKPMSGNVTVKPLVPHHVTDIPGEYGLRLVCYSNGKRAVFYSSFHAAPGDVTVPVQFSALKWEIEALALADPPQPRVVFFEVVRRIGPDRFVPEKPAPKYEIISEPTATILTMSGK